MTKKRFYTILAIIMIIVVGLLIAMYFITKKDATAPTNIINLFPFGKINTTNNTTKNTAEDSVVGGTGGDLVSVPFIPLVQLSSVPTSGMYLYGKKNEIIAQYMERTTGHIYDIALRDLAKRRISQTTTPRIYEALWANAGDSIFLRYLLGNDNKIETLSIKTPRLDNVTSNSELGEKLLPENIIDIIFSQDGKRMFYTIKTEDKRQLVGFSGETGGTIKDVFYSEFTEWLPVAFDGNTVWLQTKASYDVYGYLYKLNTKSGSFTNVIGDIKGLSALPSQSGKIILYSENTRGLFQTYIYNAETSEKVLLPIATLPEKCSWHRDETVYCFVPENPSIGKYPDDWYQGLTAFKDKLWKIDVAKLDIDIVFDTTSNGKSIDGMHAIVSEDNSVITFLNKNDSTLWAWRDSAVYGQ